MKRIVLTVTILILSNVSAWAEISGVPQLINYQGKLTDANGDPLPTAEYTLEFNIYDNSTTKTCVWGPQIFDGASEAGHGAKVPVVHGYFNVILGPVDTGDRSIMNAFSGPNRYLGIRLNGSQEIQPRQQILSAPYAITAGNIPFTSVSVSCRNCYLKNVDGSGEWGCNSPDEVVCGWIREDRAGPWGAVSYVTHMRCCKIIVTTE